MQLRQVDLISKDVAALLAFYRRLGVDIPTGLPWPDEDDPQHVGIGFRNGVELSLSGERLTNGYAPAWRGGVPGRILIFQAASREEVDERHAHMVGGGYRSHIEPFDAFWGSRYAVVDDPDGNPIGLMSEQDRAHEAAPTL
jgi:uncharacterized glyoxalase superfamily protein PhnB